MKLNLKKKILLLSILSATVPSLVIIIILTVQTNSTKNLLTKKNHEEAISQLKEISENIYKTCEVSNSLISSNLSKSLDYMKEYIDERGGASFTGTKLTWNAVNQYTKKSSSMDLSALKVGNISFNKNKDINVKTPIIDDVNEYFPATYTIFQRMNENGDMLRVATNVKKLDGDRAIGTYIPKTNPDGTPNPVVNSILKGNTFKGTAYVVNKWYQTEYRPLKNKSGKVIGIIYAGVALDEALPQLRDLVETTKVGKSGYVFVLRGKGAKKGEYVISKDGERDGENILNAKDESGKEFIKELINNATNLVKGQTFEITYLWKNPGEGKAREKIVASSYYEPFDWVIGAGTYTEELQEVGIMVENQTNKTILYSVITLLVMITIAILITVFVSNKISNPIQRSALILNIESFC
jgi:hypothetical protein